MAPSLVPGGGPAHRYQPGPPWALRAAAAPLMKRSMGFVDRHCSRWPKGRPPLDRDGVAAALRELPGWTVAEHATRLTRRYAFADFRGAMRFVVALADLANAEDHHPDFTVRWNVVEVTSWTTTPAASPTTTSSWRPGSTPSPRPPAASVARWSSVGPSPGWLPGPGQR